jgi:hypothetical protein
MDLRLRACLQVGETSCGPDRAEREEVMVGSRSGRFSYKQERELIAMAASGATAWEIAAKFRTTVATIETKAEKLGLSLRELRPLGRRLRRPEP